MRGIRDDCNQNEMCACVCIESPVILDHKNDLDGIIIHDCKYVLYLPSHS